MSQETDRIRAINAVLAKWHGQQAEFWSYTAALATLEIRLSSARRPGNVHLICSPCVSLQGPVYWERCALTVVAEDSADEPFVVQDEAAGVRVLCRQVQVLENV
jgi:hypothetical protein